MIVWDGTAPRTETYVMGPGDPQGTASPERAASGLPSQRRLVEGSLAADYVDGVARRRYRPGEVEEIAVAAVVREALWTMLLRSSKPWDELPIEALVDEAAIAAAQVMARVVTLGGSA